MWSLAVNQHTGLAQNHHEVCPGEAWHAHSVVVGQTQPPSSSRVDVSQERHAPQHRSQSTSVCVCVCMKKEGRETNEILLEVWLFLVVTSVYGLVIKLVVTDLVDQTNEKHITWHHLQQIKDSTYHLPRKTYYTLTSSLSKDARVGGVLIRNRAESRRVLSKVLSSTSRKRSLFEGTGSMGIQRVERSTWEAVLKEGRKAVCLAAQIVRSDTTIQGFSVLPKHTR